MLLVERDAGRRRLRSGPSHSSARCAAARSSDRPGRSRRCPRAATSPITPSAKLAVAVDRDVSIAPSSPGMPQAIAPPSNAGPAGQDAARMRSRLPTISSVFVPMSMIATSRSSLRQVDRQHAGRRVGAEVAADDRHAVDARLRVDRQQALLAGLRRGWSWSACPPPFRSR